MITKETTISNKLGLHARAATKFANLCSRYGSSFKITCGAKTVDGKSIMSLMLLAAAQGTDIVICTEGEDEQEAMSALIALIEDKFGEGE